MKKIFGMILLFVAFGAQARDLICTSKNSSLEFGIKMNNTLTKGVALESATKTFSVSKMSVVSKDGELSIVADNGRSGKAKIDLYQTEANENYDIFEGEAKINFFGEGAEINTKGTEQLLCFARVGGA